jgi:hypothetical protein
MVERRLGGLGRRGGHDRRQKPIVYPTSRVGRAIGFRGLSHGLDRRGGHDRRQKPIVYPTSRVGRAIGFRGLSQRPYVIPISI